ncbi:MAG: serine/threonine-protein kinase, partial [Acidobacteriota bacterium]|nr:serine/threonine-protein kinase [Acidobacteriota bacterium]
GSRRGSRAAHPPGCSGVREGKGPRVARRRGGGGRGLCRAGERGAFGAEEAALIGTDICRALAAVHAAGLVHRDVKTGNVMREEGGRIVLLDFSSVTERSESAPANVPGTPIYMAPELFRGEDSGIAVDLYALGVVLYRLVTARYPIEADSIVDLGHKHERGESTPLRDVRPDLPTGFVRVVERALSADPRARHATAGELERELAAAIGTPSTPKTESFTTRPAAFSRRAWLAAAALVVVAAVTALALPWSSWLGGFHVEASIFRLGEGTEERMRPGGQVVLGDQLFLELSASRETYVYVINEDDVGNKYLLFPLPTLDLKNPLAAGATHRLPGTIEGEPFYWDVSNVGGEELILVIASLERQTDLEGDLAELTQASRDRAVQLDTPAVNQALRGLGRLSSDPSSPDASDGRIGDLARRLSERATGMSGLWVWEMRLNSRETEP